MMPEQRSRFVRLLHRLGADDPAARAEAAEAVVNTLRTRGWSWDDLIAPASGGAIPTPAVEDDWRVTVARLLARPDLLPADEAALLRKVSAWRRLDKATLAHVRQIAEALARRERAG
jgi:hypothetical protein